MLWTDKVRSKSGKQVSFDLTPVNPKDHADESQGNTDNMSHTTPEDYEEVMTLDANLPVTTTIPASCRPTSINGLDVTEQIVENTDCPSTTSGQTNIGPLTDMAEVSRTYVNYTDAGELNYMNYTDAREPCTFQEACRAPDAELWQTAMQSETDSIYANDMWEMILLPANKKASGCSDTSMYPEPNNPGTRLG